MSSKCGVPKFAGVVLVCVGVAVSVVIVVVTLSTMGTMREGAVRAKANGASTQSQATTVAAPVTNTGTNTGDVSANTGDASANTDNAPSNTDSTDSTSGSNEQQVVVKSGDTLTDLSREYGRSVDAIANYNGIRDVNLIYEDSVLVIPASCDGN